MLIVPSIRMLLFLITYRTVKGFFFPFWNRLLASFHFLRCPATIFNLPMRHLAPPTILPAVSEYITSVSSDASITRTHRQLRTWNLSQRNKSPLESQKQQCTLSKHRSESDKHVFNDERSSNWPEATYKQLKRVTNN